ncbi:MAG: acetate kinase [Phycisphaerae bacterium]|jgi:acetate kinase|nr:acetate kinase [Phycisphaerae bacterium]
MNIFVVNCGSSSIKYQLFDMPGETPIARGEIERVGTDDALLQHETGAGVVRTEVAAPDHAIGLKIILDALVSAPGGVLDSVDEIDGVGHRVVHGGTEATGSVPIDEAVIAILRRNVDLAPLHNPANLAGIRAAVEAMPRARHVGVFDTAFLATLPEKAYRYAVPEQWYTEHRVRRYGFHGTSHKYVTLCAADLLGKDPETINLITVHMGNGVSMTAVSGGKAVDHSMGMTPLQGLMMGTRSGDIDPAIVFHMISHGMTVDEVDEALNKRSGLFGVSQGRNDMRDLLSAVEGGDTASALAIDMFIYRIIKYIGAYYAILPPLDAVVMTGGVGENSPIIRGRICSGLHRLGVIADPQANADVTGGLAGRITTADSPLSVWVIPTNEEVMIARETARFVNNE